MRQSLSACFFNNWAFFLRLLHERPSSITCIFIIVIAVILFIVLCIITKKRGQLSIISMITILSLCLGLIATQINAIGDNSDEVIISTYEEAESLYERGEYQDARKLYWTLYAKDYRKCREKMVLCDIQIANNYITRNEYDMAFRQLFGYLCNDPAASSQEAVAEMRSLVESAAGGVSDANRARQSFVNADWALGKWSDTSGHYIHFYASDSGISCEQNLSSLNREVSRYEFADGILSYNAYSSYFWIDEFIFCPTSEDNESYVYSITAGKMYFLTRNDEPFLTRNDEPAGK